MKKTAEYKILGESREELEFLTKILLEKPNVTVIADCLPSEPTEKPFIRLAVEYSE
jgi:hypothetical protein